jgi:thiol-disulfide isomerase/thioredoxin
MSSSRSVTAALATSIVVVVSVLAAHHVHQQLAARRRRQRGRRLNDNEEEAERQPQPAAATVKRQPVELSSREEWVKTYPSLSGAFNSCSSSSSSSSADGLVGILFAAGWCDDCQEFVPRLRKFVELNQKLEREGQDGSLRSFTVMYVSSDRSREEMDRFKPTRWLEVPYEQAQERTQLKRHFGACAKKELDDANLGMTVHDRRHGIPTLVLVEASTGRIVSEIGVAMVTNVMEETMVDDDDANEHVEDIAREAIDRFWRELSLLQEQ